ncbi:S8 family peptidase [Paenibacillus thiaminolyticus]|uniref:S8 family peptidase n=1 Tax=Paenibacillus thiaminolyticus TaxID=49283 RepID=A0AAP9DVT9_PANTH|nr:S8 family peptidase [Paenibacillus thiaminolyticus]MCY9535501.1 S8 family peptidase [Paenibacillus thiaminolyticus]MCY9604881.1 S8 family peptidase [Paenibacillus thiaminolyticus]MCY9610068.1 S8 family peptidase [Paenibacillus thiaminolyticus]MCY9616151.1 S8 family peptidase [Paenibacillus thiaminolyticus]MCY9621086.1 S8 family peptidase [Paenibacillus thiaminolyticus]
MDMTALLHMLLQEMSFSGRPAAKQLIRFHRPERFAVFSKALRRLRRNRPELQHIRELPLIRAWSCPVPESAAQLLSRYPNEFTIEDDALIAIQAASHRPVTWERGIPWGVRQIKAPQAWGTTTGHRVHIGVIDTGADYRHPDLRQSLMRGVNFVHRGMPPYDDNGHGTHIAGTIAAANQMYGIIGVAPRALIHPVKSFDENGAAYVSDIINGIEWCVRNGMHIINMSFGMKSRSKSLLQAVTQAYQSGVTVVASSGNDAKRKSVDYPARYSQTISVGATDRLRRIAPFSNRGQFVDIYAPGEKIVSSWIKGQYHEMSGTSMATSHISGAIALLLAVRPRLKPGEIKALLRRTANPIRSRKTRNIQIKVPGEVDIVRLLKEAERL